MRTLWVTGIIIAFTVVGGVNDAKAGFLTGTELLQRCESDSIARQNTCKGYLMAIDDMTNTYDTWGDLSKEFCIPEGIESKQLEKVVIKGLNEMPEKLHVSAGGLVWNVYYDAFPCD